MVHGEELQVLAQFPDEQEHVPPEHDALARAPASPGSDTAGPPLGVPPPPEELPEPPQAIKKTNDKDAMVKRWM